MKNRPTAYLVLVLASAVLGLVPCALWSDMLAPMEDNWNNWYWKGQPHPRPEFTLQNPPALFRAEVVVFKALVLPPAYVHRLARSVPTDYAVPWMKPYIETAGLPPLASTLQHLCWAVPFWLAVAACAYEALRWFRCRGSRAA